jgi:hypothetical protein
MRCRRWRIFTTETGNTHPGTCRHIGSTRPYVGDQALVDEAVRAGVAKASQLAFYEVAPLRDDGPHLINPVSDGHAVSEVRYGNDART